MKYWKKILKIWFWLIFKKFIKIKQHSINIKNYTAHPHDMVHVPAKFRENTSMRFRVTVWKLNVTDTWTDGRTDGRTDGISISPVPGPTARRQIKRGQNCITPPPPSWDLTWCNQETCSIYVTRRQTFICCCFMPTDQAWNTLTLILFIQFIISHAQNHNSSSTFTWFIMATDRDLLNSGQIKTLEWNLKSH